MDTKINRVYPTVTSVMWHPTPELRERWLRQYGKDRFTFEEALYAQTFPKEWLFPISTTKKWKWLAEGFPPKVAEYLFNTYVKGSNLVLLDLFAGIGGWGLGAVWSKKFKKIIMVEIDKEKCSYLKMNFERLGADFEVICSDVRKIDVIKADVISVSPPCEDLTILRFFSGNKISKGTVPLTVYALDYVNRVRPAIAFYENVYSKVLVDVLRKYGWHVERFDMSKIIPQKRVRLIGIRQFKNSVYP
jgi:site-specific DNA-cytosine methylase